MMERHSVQSWEAWCESVVMVYLRGCRPGCMGTSLSKALFMFGRDHGLARALEQTTISIEDNR